MNLPLATLIAQAVSTRPTRPFIDPIHIPGFNLHDHWWLTLIPLAFFTSMAYKAVRLPDLSRYWRQVLIMTIQIVGAMIILAAAIYLLIEVIVPLLDR